MELYHEIKQQTYAVGKSLCFIINKPVKREIFAAGFRDRIVHHLLFNYMNPLIERTLIADCYSCRKGKGTLYGIERLKKHIKQCSQNYTQDCYVLKLDIQGYFMNINRDKLQVQVNSIIDQYGYLRDESGVRFEDSYRAKLVNYLLPIVINNNPTSDCIIKSSPEEWDTLPKDKSLFHSPINVGLPIGNLTSQLFSNVYLNKLDQFVTRELKIKHYGRYVDDFFLIHRSKEYLKKAVGILREFLSAKLGLMLHPRKIVLQHYKKGVAFLGAIVKPYRVYVNRRIAVNFKNSCLQCEQRLTRGQEDIPNMAVLHDLRITLNSHLGLLRHFSTYKLKSKTLQKIHKVYEYGCFGTHYNVYLLNKAFCSLLPPGILKNRRQVYPALL